MGVIKNLYYRTRDFAHVKNKLWDTNDIGKHDGARRLEDGLSR